MAVAADNQGARQAEAEFGSDNMDDALTGLIDIEHRDAIGRRFHSQSRQQFPPDLDGAGPPGRRGNGVVRRRKRQLRIMDSEIAAFEIEQAARPAKIVKQMTIDVEKIGIIANSCDDVLVPDFGQQRATTRVHDPSSLFGI
jgi:hypothetical protein